MKRDFTYIDDIVEGIVRLIPVKPQNERGTPYQIYNIGNNNPEDLMELVRLVEQETGQSVKKNLLPMQQGDVKATYADISRLQAVTGFAPRTPLAEGVKRFVEWYKGYYRV